MASHRNALSYLIPGFTSYHFTGFYFYPTDEDAKRIVNLKNAGAGFPFEVDDDLFGCPPEQLEECYCFTKLKPIGKNKVNRTLRDYPRWFWKNKSKKSTGWVTQFVLHKDKNTPTEWHITEYRDTEMADADRYVLCRIYKTGKNKDSGSSSFLDPNIDNATVLPHVPSDVGAGQISSSTSQVSSMWADVNQVQQNEMGQYPRTEPDCFSNAGINPYLTGEHLNHYQNPSVDYSWYSTSQAGMDYIPQQFPSSSNSIDRSDLGRYSYSNRHPFDELNVIFDKL